MHVTCTSKLITSKVLLPRKITILTGNDYLLNFFLTIALFCDHTSMQHFTTTDKDECALP